MRTSASVVRLPKASSSLRRGLHALLLAPTLLVATSASAAPVMLEGEVFARSTALILPPAVDAMWQFTITRLAADGAPVKQGEVVVAFDAAQLMTQLTQKQSALKEKLSEQERQRLDLAERERQERLASEERSAALDKATRKSTQPADLIGRNDYAKLVIEREQAARQLALAQTRERLAAEQRRQEERLLSSEVAQLSAEVDELQRSLAALQVPAPRDGVVVHRSSFNNEKFDVGSQVWRGLAVAEIPDLATLAVRATLPERDLTRVSAGQPVRVSVEGGAGVALRGEVAEVGRSVRSKSRVQPVPVVDVVVLLEGNTTALRPGQPVRVELLDESAASDPAGVSP